MKELIHDEDVRMEGIEIGEKNTLTAIVESWLKKGKSISQIAEDLDRSEEYIRELVAFSAKTV